MNTHFSSQLIFDITSLKSLSPLQLHSFLQLLIRYEQAPGGPYLFPVDDAEIIALNRHIFELFKAANKPLPNIEQFLATQSAPALPVMKAKPSTSAHAHVLRQLLGKQAYTTIKPLVITLEDVDISGELSKLSTILAHCLKENGKDAGLSERTLRALGKANFLIWVAYSLYDHLLDETTKPQLLPIANQVLRLAIESYLTVGIPFEHINKALQIVDQANEYEVRDLRVPVVNGYITFLALPPQSELIRLQSERSYVHCLGPLYVIEQTKQINIVPEIIDLFKEYCAVRQFNDDIHDWQEDLINGRITYPVHWLLQRSSFTSGTHHLDELVPKLQQLFWEEGLVALVSECLERSIKVRAGYCKSIGLKKSSAFDMLTIDPIITVCQQALKKHAFETAFLEVTQLHRSVADS